MSAKKIINTFIVACLLQFGASAQNETVELNSFYDSLSFALGIDKAVSLNNTDENFKMLDKMAVIRGFQSHIFGEPMGRQCNKTVQKFLGSAGNEFNTAYLKEGSECLGKYVGFQFYTEMKQIQYLEDLNMSLVLKGFKLGMYKQDEKFLSPQTRVSLIMKFSKFVQENLFAEINRNDKAFWSEVLKIEGIDQIGETGIYYETIEQGNGGKPTSDSDIKAHYILTNAVGDTLESSYNGKSALKINLGSVIAGWKEGFPALEKGGKYRLYVPYEKAYKGGRPQAPQGALCFYIEFIDFGPKGTIAPPPPTIKRIKH